PICWGICEPGQPPRGTSRRPESIRWRCSRSECPLSGAIRTRNAGSVGLWRCALAARVDVGQALTMTEPRRIVRFRGGVGCRRDELPLGLTLIGRAVERPEERVSVVFAGSAPQDLPEALEDASVEQLEEGRYRIWSARREWLVSARTVHVHREVATLFYKA